MLALLEGHKFMWMLTCLGMLFFGPIGALAGLPGLAIDALIQRRAARQAGQRAGDTRADVDVSDEEYRQRNPYGLWPKSYARRLTPLLLGSLFGFGGYATIIYGLDFFGFGPVMVWISFTGTFADMLAAFVPAFSYYSRLFANNGRWGEIAVISHIYSASFVFMILQIGLCVDTFNGSVSQIISEYKRKSKGQKIASALLAAACVLVFATLFIVSARWLYLGFPLEKYMGPEQVPGSFLWPFILFSSFTVPFYFLAGSVVIAYAMMVLDWCRSRRSDTA